MAFLFNCPIASTRLDHKKYTRSTRCHNTWGRFDIRIPTQYTCVITQVSLEEERLLREREKEERERIRQHMSAAQHLQRLQVGRNYPGEMRKTPAARFRFNVIALHRWRVFTLMPARVVDYTFVSARACVHM
eukprot:5361164-Pyramimonas_sp.AAC.1